MDTAALKTAIQAVEENNRINDAAWSDFSDASQVEETYEVRLDERGKKVINRAIHTEGESLKTDLPAIEKEEWGQNFAGSFWDRDGCN